MKESPLNETQQRTQNANAKFTEAAKLFTQAPRSVREESDGRGVAARR